MLCHATAARFFNVDPAHGAVGVQAMRDLDLVEPVAVCSTVQVLMDIAGIAIVCGLGYLFLEMPAKWR